MTDFNVYKNVTETFNLIIPDFIVSTETTANSIDATAFSVTPSFILSPICTDLTTTSAVATPTSVTSGTPTSPPYYSTTATNCFILETLNYSFSSTSTELGIGSSGSNSYKTWIPFVVPLTGTIVSAAITFTAAEDSGGTNVAIRVGCELSGNPIAPAGVTLPDYYNDLNSRIMTTAITYDYSVPIWTVGSTYSYDITPSIQEVLNLSTWVSGHIIAVMIRDNGSDIGMNRQIASYQNGTYTAPILTITT